MANRAGSRTLSRTGGHRHGVGRWRSKSICRSIPARSPTSLQLRFGMPAGYAWYFPKRDHANVGILTTDALTAPGPSQPHSAAMSRNSASIAGQAASGATGSRCRCARVCSSRAGVLLAGDAAGAADPLFGEGIRLRPRAGEHRGRCRGRLGGWTGVEPACVRAPSASCPRLRRSRAWATSAGSPTRCRRSRSVRWATTRGRAVRRAAACLDSVRRSRSRRRPFGRPLVNPPRGPRA